MHKMDESVKNGKKKNKLTKVKKTTITGSLDHCAIVYSVR